MGSKDKLRCVIFAIIEPWRCAGSLPECPLPRRQQDAGDQLCGALGREEGVDQGGAHLATEANV